MWRAILAVVKRAFRPVVIIVRGIALLNKNPRRATNGELAVTDALRLNRATKDFELASAVDANRLTAFCIGRSRAFGDIALGAFGGGRGRLFRDPHFPRLALVQRITSFFDVHG